MLVLKNITKQFEAVRALDSVDLDVGAGTIHSVLGANGSGKSTLIKMLSGIHTPDEGGQIVLRGEQITPPLHPSRLGIAIVHQDLGLFLEGTVLENVGITSGYGGRRGIHVSWRAERGRVEKLLSRFGHIPVNALVSELEPAQRTMVAIARAFRELEDRHVEQPLLLLDEPTVTLPPAEVEKLFAMMRGVVTAGGSVIFITHRLKEALDISDHVTVLREGRVVESGPASASSVGALVHAMHGQLVPPGARAPQPVSSDRAPVLETRGLAGSVVSGINLALRPGEVVGITGLAGMGQDELPYLLAGAAAPREGVIEYGGVQRQLTPRSAWAAGVVLLPANRAEQAIWPAGRLTENFTITALGRYFNRGRLSSSGEWHATANAATEFAVRASGPDALISSLSGGNQQKLVLARALDQGPKVLLLHEPFIGIDAAARAFVVETVKKAAASGCAIALFSIEYELLAEVCSRVLVLIHGKVDREIPAEDLSESRIIEAAQHVTIGTQ